MFTLERLTNAAEVMRQAGYEPYGYQGRHSQSLESAVAYYVASSPRLASAERSRPSARGHVPSPVNTKAS